MTPPSARYGIYLGDLDRSRTSSQGIVNFALSTVTAMADLTEPNERLVLLSSASIRPELPAAPGVEIVALPDLRSGLKRIWRDQVDVLREARRRRLDLLYFPKGFAPVAPARVPVVTTIHDDIALRYASGAYGFRAVTLGGLYAAAGTILTLRRAAVVTTVSAFSARRLSRWRGRRPPLFVTANVAPTGAPLAGIAKRGLCAFGSSFRHKRSQQAVDWMLRLRDERLPGEPVVVIGGPAVARSPGLTHVPGPLGGDEVQRRVSAARLLITCSDYEGFGMPAFEAWVWGTPSLHPAIPPYDETLPGIPGEFTLDSYPSFRQAADQLLELSPGHVRRTGRQIQDRYPASRPAATLLSEFRRLVS